MVQILPFRGLRYAMSVLDDVATPPYDVIDEPMRDRLYRRHPANFVRVDLNRPTEADTDTDNPYTRADAFLREWEQAGLLVPEEQPAIYAYSQTWTQDGETIERKGAIVLLRLEAFESGQVLPHEFTLKGPKIDRMRLMAQTLCNLSQVFMIYDDPDRILENTLFEPADTGSWMSATDEDGTVHRFRPVMDAAVIDRLQAMLRNQPLLIADGHHRYETALAFQQEVRDRWRAQTGAEPPPSSLLSDYHMVFITNMADPGLRVFPTHRILYRWPHGWDMDRFEAALLQRFDAVDSGETFTYRCANDHRVKLRLKPEYRSADRPPLLQDYDAAILEDVVFQGIFGQTGEALKQSHHVGFYRDEVAIDALWRQHEAVAGFYLEAPSVKRVHDVCRSGYRMPQKSTYFYPKIQSGLVIYPYRRFTGQDGHALQGVVAAHPIDAMADLVGSGPSSLR